MSMIRERRKGSFKVIRRYAASRTTLVGLALVAITVGLAFSYRQKQNNTAQEGTFSQSVANLPRAIQSQVADLKDGATYNLTASIVKKRIGGQDVKMLAYNGLIPGPTIRVKQGSEITLNFTNNTDVDSTIHSHGVRVDNKFDGVPNLTQQAVKPGQSFTYTLKFPDPGVYWYHPHIREDYAQELGLYGNYIVEPNASDYWAEVDREETIFLDDIAIQNGTIAQFSKTTVDHALMGRFGNVMLVNGKDSYKLTVNQGERVRFYLTNAANTRVFNVSIPNARMKLVGSDNGKYERETWVDSVLLGPSERAIVEVWFDKAGDYQIIHKTPAKTYSLGIIAVAARPVTISYMLIPRENQDMIASLATLRPLFAKPADKKLALSLDMMGNQNMMGGQSNAGGHMMGNGMMNNNQMMGTNGTDKIEWEDTTGMMNAMATSQMIKWQLVDQATNKSNMDIGWQFKQGDIVKLSMFNDPKSAHPMQHPIHIHGQRFLVTTVNGIPNDNLVYKDTVLVQKGDTVDLLVAMDNPGTWLIHCHIPEHMEAGMMSSFIVQ